jgi:hypothetical protein
MNAYTTGYYETLDKLGCLKVAADMPHNQEKAYGAAPTAPPEEKPKDKPKAKDKKKSSAKDAVKKQRTRGSRAKPDGMLKKIWKNPLGKAGIGAAGAGAAYLAYKNKDKLLGKEEAPPPSDLY